MIMKATVATKHREVVDVVQVRQRGHDDLLGLL